MSPVTRFRASSMAMRPFLRRWPFVWRRRVGRTRSSGCVGRQPSTWFKRARVKTRSTSGATSRSRQRSVCRGDVGQRLRLGIPDLITANVIYRVFRLKVRQYAGTGFAIEEGGREYLVTARHLAEPLRGRRRTSISMPTRIFGRWTLTWQRKRRKRESGATQGSESEKASRMAVRYIAKEPLRSASLHRLAPNGRPSGPHCRRSIRRWALLVASLALTSAFAIVSWGPAQA